MTSPHQNKEVTVRRGERKRLSRKGRRIALRGITAVVDLNEKRRRRSENEGCRAVTQDLRPEQRDREETL